MNEEQYWLNKDSNETHAQCAEHQSKMNTLVQAEEMNLFSLLKPTVSIDGNQYCVLYGENLQEGIAGFGDTLELAIWDFNKQFQNPVPEKKS